MNEITFFFLSTTASSILSLFFSSFPLKQANISVRTFPFQQQLSSFVCCSYGFVFVSSSFSSSSFSSPRCSNANKCAKRRMIRSSDNEWQQSPRQHQQQQQRPQQQHEHDMIIKPSSLINSQVLDWERFTTKKCRSFPSST